jgi:predicted metal-dependent HD superfamily phosphohydrolase
METNDEAGIYEKMVRTEITGTLCALKVIPVADNEHELVQLYMELMKPSEIRQFHSFQYVVMCMKFAREFFKFQNPPIVNAAILFHKLGYIPGDKRSIRKTCELALRFSQGEHSVMLLGFIKAMQTRNSLHRRYGDERDCLADVANYFYGTTDYDTFKKNWAKILIEFRGAGFSPQKFKKFTRHKLGKMLPVAQVCGMYHTSEFLRSFNEQAICNITQMLDENS